MSANGVDLAWMDGLLAGYLTSWLTCAVSLTIHSSTTTLTIYEELEDNGQIEDVLAVDPFSLPPDSLPGLFSDAEAAIQSCHRAIERYQHVIRRLSKQRNACTITSRIPREVLGKIMFQAIRFKQGSTSIAAFERVSHHWRQVALGTPRLWAYILVNYRVKEPVIRMLVSRSRSAPLYISVYPDGDPEIVLKLLQETAPRIRRLTMQIYASSIRLFQKLQPQSLPFPQLRTLTLHCSRPGLSDTDFDHSIPLFHLDGPSRLTKLVFVAPGYNMSKTLPLLAASSITSCQLVGSSSSYGREELVQGLASPSDFLAALRAMPRLKELYVKGHVLSVNEPGQRTDATASLLNLDMLAIWTSTSRASWLLDHVRVSPRTDVSIICDDVRYGSDIEITTYAASVANFLSSHRDRQKLPASSENRYTCTLWNGKDEDGATPNLCHTIELHAIDPADPDSSLSGPVTVKIAFGEQRIKAYVGPLWDALPLDQIHTLLVRRDCAGYDSWEYLPVLERCMARMHALEVLTIEEWPPSWLANMGLLHKASKPDGELCFPRLRKLVLSCVPLDEGPEKPRSRKRAKPAPREDPATVRSWNLSTLGEVLAGREAKDGSIEAITFEECDLSEKEVGTFGLKAEVEILP
ncbi:hypothetical protein EIP91_009137 [Steccherinum ochraceum]|uniref:F-box domain-containing protein n=1 Tax=Steccherinum ochraceum TaxID=92696 RepID=A0A4R0R4P3_9APHY|nr:hypothetical protein EIP91_009137 [Steccherinum ochraceum]